MAIVLNYIFFIWLIYVLDMFSGLWRQQRWKWKRAFSSSHQEFSGLRTFYLNILGLRPWKGDRKVLKSQLLIQLLTKGWSPD